MNPNDAAVGLPLQPLGASDEGGANNDILLSAYPQPRSISELDAPQISRPFCLSTFYLAKESARMEPPTPSAPPEFILEAFADPSSIKDVVRGILHTIFFNRFLQAIYPQTREVLDISLPYIPDAELETMIDQRTQALVRQLDAERHQSHPGGGGGGGGGAGRGQVTVQFYERRRRKTTAWTMLGRGDEEVCWERWTVKVTIAEPRTESGTSSFFPCSSFSGTPRD
jgi:hypothetical protein